MKKIFRIFRNDIRKLRTNLMAFAVAIGICVLPALYAWFNIVANWDPYSNTGNIKVAVANCDEGTELFTETICIGDQITENLKKNDKMGWTFVTREEAEEGVEKGDYYACVIIPENFSECFTSVLSGDLERPEITYMVNEKKNAIAPKITDKGAEAIKLEVNTSFIDTVTEKLAASLKASSETGEDRISDIKENLNDSLDEVSESLTAFRTSVSLITSTVDASDVMIQNAKAAVPDIEKVLASSGSLTENTKDSLKSARSATSQIMTGADLMFSSADSLYQSITSDISSVNSAVSSSASDTADKLRNISAANQRIIDVENGILTFVKDTGSKLGTDTSLLEEQLNKSIEKQQEINDKINSTADEIVQTGNIPSDLGNELSGMIADSKNSFETVRNTYGTSVKTSVSNSVDSLFDTLDNATDILNTVNGTSPDVNAMLDSSSASLQSLKSSLEDLDSVLESSCERVSKLKEKVNKIMDNESLITFIEDFTANPSELGEFMSSPVKINTVSVYHVENYGSAMAPFYTVLAIWVGSVVLVAVFKTDISKKDLNAMGGNISAVQEYFGRYLIFLMCSVIQAVVISLGDLYLLKIQCQSPGLLIFVSVCSAAVFSLLIYSLTITFSVVGKGLAVILLVLQVAGSGGTFPPEVLPSFFQKILPYLPFKYCINAMREAVAGEYEGNWEKELSYLLAYIALSLLTGIVLRKPCMKIMSFFNRRIEETDLII